MMRGAAIGGLEVSVIGLGCNNLGRGLDREDSGNLVRAALDVGIDYFDTARLYGNGDSERYLAYGLGTNRDRVAVATKFGRIPRIPDAPGADRTGIRANIEVSLSELDTDYIDHYQLHFPDAETPIAETLSVLAELVEEGKVREIGCCNFDATQLREALDESDANGWPRFVSNQVEYSMVHRRPESDGLAALCIEEGVALLPYYPLASGLLTGKTHRDQPPQGRLKMERYERFLTEPNFDLVEQLSPFADARGLTLAQVAIAWLLTREAVPAVTPGATLPEQIISNVAAADWEPSAAELAELGALLTASDGTGQRQEGSASDLWSHQ